MINSCERNAQPVGNNTNAPLWKDLSTKRFTNLAAEGSTTLSIKRNDLVYIQVEGGGKSVALVNAIKAYDSGDDLLWIHWCYTKNETTLHEWPEDCPYVLSSHQEIHKADTICGKFEEGDKLSNEYLYLPTKSATHLQPVESARWLQTKLLMAKGQC